eukprot:855245_1
MPASSVFGYHDAIVTSRIQLWNGNFVLGKRSLYGPCKITDSLLPMVKQLFEIGEAGKSAIHDGFRSIFTPTGMGITLSPKRKLPIEIHKHAQAGASAKKKAKEAKKTPKKAVKKSPEKKRKAAKKCALKKKKRAAKNGAKGKRNGGKKKGKKKGSKDFSFSVRGRRNVDLGVQADCDVSDDFSARNSVSGTGRRREGQSLQMCGRHQSGQRPGLRGEHAAGRQARRSVSADQGWLPLPLRRPGRQIPADEACIAVHHFRVGVSPRDRRHRHCGTERPHVVVHGGRGQSGAVHHEELAGELQIGQGCRYVSKDAFPGEERHATLSEHLRSTQWLTDVLGVVFTIKYVTFSMKKKKKK